MDEAMFGRYRLLSVIGSGGMGKVYRAHDTVMDREVAIKVVSAALADEPGYRDRFRREARTATRVTEPHIVPVYDAGEIDGNLYLVMLVVQGEDLDKLLRREGPLAPERAVSVIEQLASALDAAHGAGLVHRDIKPSNAIVTSRDFVYLIDFGLAAEVAGPSLTSTNAVFGSWAYMAPERFSAVRADARSDIYSLACVLYECLTGVPPFPGRTLEQQYAAHVACKPPDPHALNTRVPVGFGPVIAQGMAKAPADRYRTADELAVAARAALTAPASTVSPSTTDANQRETSRQPTDTMPPRAEALTEPEVMPQAWAPIQMQAPVQAFPSYQALSPVDSLPPPQLSPPVAPSPALDEPPAPNSYLLLPPPESARSTHFWLLIAAALLAAILIGASLAQFAKAATLADATAVGGRSCAHVCLVMLTGPMLA